MKLWTLAVPESMVAKDGQKKTFWRQITKVRENEKGVLKFRLPPGVSLSGGDGNEYFLFPPRKGEDFGPPDEGV